MPNLILASNSPQRKKLLKQLGLKFSIIPSRVEEIKKIQTTCSAFVKDNALLKATDVASRRSQGVIVGSDTIVYIGNKKVIGKPRNLKEAKKNLKILFDKPRWVYTGVAIIDAATKKTLVDYEKTKVFMTKLSSLELDQYYKRVSAMDKAGGFDIEGWGASFIHRIEGCYTNVIGLPMAKLTLMLKEFDISVLN